MWRAGPGCCLQGHLHVGGGCPQDARGAMSDLTNRRTTDSEEGQHPVSQRGSVLPLQMCIRFAPPLNNVRSSGVDTGCFPGSHWHLEGPGPGELQTGGSCSSPLLFEQKLQGEALTPCTVLTRAQTFPRAPLRSTARRAHWAHAHEGRRDYQTLMAGQERPVRLHPWNRAPQAPLRVCIPELKLRDSRSSVWGGYSCLRKLFS